MTSTPSWRVGGCRANWSTADDHEAMILWALGLVWSAEHGSRGHLPSSVVERLCFLLVETRNLALRIVRDALRQSSTCRGPGSTIVSRPTLQTLKATWLDGGGSDPYFAPDQQWFTHETTNGNGG
jgi:hypothetical protein